MQHARSKLSTITYPTPRRPSSQPSRRSQYTTSTHSLPQYHPRAPARHTRRTAPKNLPPPYEDLMKTVDYRYTEQPPRYRSSFALSDIWEVDEVEISNILPSSPEYEESIELARKRSLFRKKVLAFVMSLRIKWSRAPARCVTSPGSNQQLDLLA